MSMDNEQKIHSKRYHRWWWTVEPRHAPCAQCSDEEQKAMEKIPFDLVWGMLVNEK